MPLAITIDTGNKQIKGETKTLSAGLVVSDKPHPFGVDNLRYNGKYYAISDDRIPYMADKTVDERYFILSLFSAAYDLVNLYPDLSSEDYIEVDLLIGLPPKHFAAMCDRYHDYFARNEYIEFALNDRSYCLYITNVYVYPQAYAAIAPIIDDLLEIPKAMVIDIGGYTADLISVRNGRPQMNVVESEEYGTIKFYNKVKSKARELYDNLLEESDIDDVLQNKPHMLSHEVAELIHTTARQYMTDFFNRLRELEIDLKTCYAVFVGGGSVLFRAYIEEQAPRMGRYQLYTNLRANAEGYKLLYESEKG